MDTKSPDPRPASWSGRWTVAIFVAVVLAGWFGLDRAFRAWTASYQERATFGATQVAPTVDPLARLDPPGIPPEAWRSAVADTHALLVALCGSGVVDQAQMEQLRRRLTAQVEQATAHPEQARAILSAVWDQIEHDAGPAIAPDLVPPPAGSRHARRHPRPPRPSLLGPTTLPPKKR